MGLVAGAYGELPSAFHVITDLIASQLADGHSQFIDIDHGTCKSILLQHVRRSLGLALHRGWAKPMPGRCRNLVQHPNRRSRHPASSSFSRQGFPCLPHPFIDSKGR